MLNPQAGDMDGDGDDDLIIGTRWGYVAYYERLSNGNLAAADTIYDLPGGDNSQPLVLDYDNDGDLDLLLTGHDTPDLPIFLFKSNGDLAASVKGSNPDTVPSPLMGSKDKYPTIAMADLDGDGLKDLIYAISCYDINIKNGYLKIRWYKNKGSLTAPYFDNFEYLTFDGVDSVDDVKETYKVPYITATDYNSDGVPDILLGASQQKLAVPEEQLVVWYGRRLNTGTLKSVIDYKKTNITVKENVISIEGKTNENSFISMINIKGQKVLNKVLFNGEVKIPNDYCKGVYFVEIQTGNNIMNWKVLLK